MFYWLFSGLRGLVSCLLSAIRSLEAKGEVFVLLYVFFCVFVRSTISQHPAGRFTPKFACGRTLVPDVSSPLLGVSGPRRGGGRENEIFITIGVNREFLHFGGF